MYLCVHHGPRDALALVWCEVDDVGLSCSVYHIYYLSQLTAYSLRVLKLVVSHSYQAGCGEVSLYERKYLDLGLL